MYIFYRILYRAVHASIYSSLYSVSGWTCSICCLRQLVLSAQGCQIIFGLVSLFQFSMMLFRVWGYSFLKKFSSAFPLKLCPFFHFQHPRMSWQPLCLLCWETTFAACLSRHTVRKSAYVKLIYVAYPGIHRIISASFVISWTCYGLQ